MADILKWSPNNAAENGQSTLAAPSAGGAPENWVGADVNNSARERMRAIASWYADPSYSYPLTGVDPADTPKSITADAVARTYAISNMSATADPVSRFPVGARLISVDTLGAPTGAVHYVESAVFVHPIFTLTVTGDAPVTSADLGVATMRGSRDVLVSTATPAKGLPPGTLQYSDLVEFDEMLKGWTGTSAGGALSVFGARDRVVIDGVDTVFQHIDNAGVPDGEIRIADGKVVTVNGLNLGQLQVQNGTSTISFPAAGEYAATAPDFSDQVMPPVMLEKTEVVMEIEFAIARGNSNIRSLEFLTHAAGADINLSAISRFALDLTGGTPDWGSDVTSFNHVALSLVFDTTGWEANYTWASHNPTGGSSGTGISMGGSDDSGPPTGPAVLERRGHGLPLYDDDMHASHFTISLF